MDDTHDGSGTQEPGSDQPDGVGPRTDQPDGVGPRTDGSGEPAAGGAGRRRVRRGAFPTPRSEIEAATPFDPGPSDPETTGTADAGAAAESDGDPEAGEPSS